MTAAAGRFARLALAPLLAVLAACATPQTDRLLAQPGSLPPRAAVADVPFFPQEENYCGPASLAMLLAWSGLSVGQDDVAPEVFTPGREGSLRNDVIAAARRHGRLAVPVTRLSDLMAELAAGHPVLVFQNLALDWYPRWHYAVAIGYDLPAAVLLLHSGLEARQVLPLGTFEHTWRRAGNWALLVLPPDELPATADARVVLTAAASLERVAHYAEAETAYAAILGRWPDSLGALMGLGNARYAQGDRPGAADAFRQATRRHPDSPAAWNNLAQVLGELARKDEAVAAARRAVRLGGESSPIYRETLRKLGGGAG